MLAPWTILILGGLLGLLAWWGRVFPHRPLCLLLLVPTFLALWLIVMPGLWPVVLAVDGLLVAAAAIDLLSLAKARSFAVERHTGLVVSLGKSHPVSLTLTNRSERGQPVWVRDGAPDGLEADPAEFTVDLPARSRSTLRYNLRASRRGAFDLTDVYLRMRSKWGLWQRMLKLPCASHLNVYPDLKQLGEYALLARTNRLSMMGLRRTRRIGQDNEFERLRDYTIDDNFKHIDWRSTARRNKLTVKDFQANQSQRVMFLVDCGRMMTGEAAGVSLLDHALNAMLLLSYVALRQNDQVGLMCFSNEIHSFLPPRSGDQLNRLLHATYDRFPRMVESRYDEAFLHLAANVRKRTLVVLITNVVDEVNAHQIQQHLAAMSGRHLPLAVLLRDHALFDPLAAAEAVAPQINSLPPRAAAQTAVLPDVDLFRAAAAAEVLTWRRRVLADLAGSGVLLVDSFPEDLTAPLVNRYLEIKARHLL